MAMSESPASILLVEDNLTTSRTLLLFLDNQGYRTVCAYSGREAIDRFANGMFSLVILDLMLPDIDGLQVCKHVRSTSEVPIIILSAKSTEAEIVVGLEAGADDYVCKPFGSRELLARIRRCLRRVAVSPQAHRWEYRGLIVDELTRTVSVNGKTIKLTRTEFAILHVLIQKPGRVFTRDQLIARVFGIEFTGSPRTIDTHVWSLRKKIGEPPGAPAYILSEQGVGYRMSDADAE